MRGGSGQYARSDFAQEIGNRGRGQADEGLTNRAPQRGFAGQHAHGTPGYQQSHRHQDGGQAPSEKEMKENAPACQPEPTAS